MRIFYLLLTGGLLLGLNGCVLERSNQEEKVITGGWGEGNAEDIEEEVEEDDNEDADFPEGPQHAVIHFAGLENEEEKTVITSENEHAIKVRFASNIHFGYDSWQLGEEAQHTLQKLTKIINKHPDCSIFIQGHTDHRGNEAYNQKLSEKRAAAVARLAENLGMAPNKIRISGHGEIMPVADNDTEEGRARNRRVEIYIITENRHAQYLLPLETGTEVRLNNIFFQRSTARLLPSSHPELNQIAEFLKENPSVEIELHGHTDGNGDPHVNYLLSERRVATIKEYLISQGIDGKRIYLKAFGGTRPVAGNETEEMRRLNRRVEFRIVKN